MALATATLASEGSSPGKSEGYVSSWMSYLREPSPVSDLPTPDRLVLVAVLADETTVRLGPAHFYPQSAVYRMEDGNIEVPESTKGLDGVYTTDTGCYRVMSEPEYADLKRREEERLSAKASAAISSPRASRAPLPIPDPMPIKAMATLSVNPAPIGCGMHAKMATVIAVGPRNIAASVQRAKAIAETARGNNNVVTYVVLGAADDAEAQAALAIDGQCVLLAGANELRALQPRDARRAMRLYLAKATLLECIPGSGMGTSDDGSGGVWTLPTSPVPLNGTLAALASRGKLSEIEWKDALNAQWTDWYTRYNAGSGPLVPADAELLRAYTSFSTKPATPPLAWAAPNSSAVLGNSDGPPFGFTDQTLSWRHEWPEPRERWSSTGGGYASVYWTVTTWCTNTQAALRHQPPLLDLQAEADELQDDVSTTLASLVAYTAPGGDEPFKTRFNDLKGTLGPVVMGGGDGKEPLRVTWWTVPDRTGGVLMLLPESYVRHVLAVYNVRARTSHGEPLLCATGFLVLADADALHINFGGVQPGEVEEMRRSFGKRLWIPNGATARDAAAAVEGLSKSPEAAEGLKSFRTQMDSDAAQSSAMLMPGDRVPATGERTVYYTLGTSEDHLSGLRVRWILPEPTAPTLVVDAFEGGAQLAYEIE